MIASIGCHVAVLLASKQKENGSFVFLYSRIKLKVQTKLVVEGFDEKRGAMEVFTSLKQQKCVWI